MPPPRRSEIAGFLAGLHLCPRAPAPPRRHGCPRRRPPPALTCGEAWGRAVGTLHPSARPPPDLPWVLGLDPQVDELQPASEGAGGRKELLRGVEGARSLKAFDALSLSPSRSCLTRRKWREIRLLRGGFSHHQSGARQGHVGRFTDRLGEGAVAAVVGDEDSHSR